MRMGKLDEEVRFRFVMSQSRFLKSESKHNLLFEAPLQFSAVHRWLQWEGIR